MLWIGCLRLARKKAVCAAEAKRFARAASLRLEDSFARAQTTRVERGVCACSPIAGGISRQSAVSIARIQAELSLLRGRRSTKHEILPDVVFPVVSRSFVFTARQRRQKTRVRCGTLQRSGYDSLQFPIGDLCWTDDMTFRNCLLVRW